MDKLGQTLDERGSRYGDFNGHALATQEIKGVIRNNLAKNHVFLGLGATEQAVALEALEMIAHKIGRIVNGDPLYADSWVDIEGYSRIARERLCGEEG